MQAIATMFRFNEAEMGALIFWQHLAYLVTLPLYICGCVFFSFFIFFCSVAVVLEQTPLTSFYSLFFSFKKKTLSCMYWMDKLPINWREGGVLNKIVGGTNDPGLTP